MYTCIHIYLYTYIHVYMSQRGKTETEYTQKGALIVRNLAFDLANVSAQNRPIPIAKEAYFYGKRGLFR